jgi:hypothetical protein
MHLNRSPWIRLHTENIGSKTVDIHSRYLEQIARRTADLVTLYRTIGHHHLQLGQSMHKLADLYDQIDLSEDEPTPAPIAEMAVHPPTEPCAPPIDEPAISPTTRAFTKDQLWNELRLPGGQNSLRDTIIDQTRWSIVHEIVFKSPDLPDGYGWETSYSVGATESQDEGPWDNDDDPIKCTLVRLGKATVDAWLPAVMPLNDPPKGVDHAHELGSCTFCDTMPTTNAEAVAMVSELRGLGHAVFPAESAPDVTPSSEIRHVDLRASETPAIESVPSPPSGVRKRNRTDVTAKEWAHGVNFTKYVSSTEPFKDWPADKQNEARDRFVSAQPPDEIMNRWGPRFAKFCGVR